MVLAFGKTPEDLGVPGEARPKGRGVSYCTICDAALYRGKDVVPVSWGEPPTRLLNLVNRFYWVFPSNKPVQDEESPRGSQGQR